MKAFQNIFIRSAIPVVPVDFIYSHPYRQSGSEFFMLHPQGESTLLHCHFCDFWGNQKFTQSTEVNPSDADLNPLEKVHTPGTKTIEDLAKYLNIAKSQTAKAVFMTATMLVNNEKSENVVMAIVRGDKELDENKLLRVINAMKIRPSTDSEIESIGAVPGFASPVGLKDALIVVDDLVTDSPNLVAGANEVDFHFRNVNYQRDFQAQLIADITTISSGDPCPQCQQPLEEQSAFLLGRINAPDTKLSTKTNCNFQDENAVMKPVLIGSGWLDLEPILGGVAESNHDPFGLIWPFPLAPYQVHLIVLPSKNTNDPVEIAEKLFKDLQRARIEVLFDDRKESPGVKFNDADLLGIPIRVTVAEKSLSQGFIELKNRNENEKKTIPLDDAVPTIMHSLLRLEREIAQKLT